MKTLHFYLPIWSLKTSKPYLDIKKNYDTEKRVSKYLRENFTFAVFEVDTKEERQRLEKAIIATVNQEPTFVSGAHWLGNYSQENEIRESGL